jgi:hypothetical protein
VAQYDVYNCILRRYPEKRFQAFSDGGNLFSTTIAVLASAVQKLSRAVSIPEGTLFYRGLPRMMELPDAFFKPDAKGRCGFTDYGFVSTTLNKKIAFSYAGVDRGCGPIPMVVVIQATAIDRGAPVEVLSQYPQVGLFTTASALPSLGDCGAECSILPYLGDCGAACRKSSTSCPP